MTTTIDDLQACYEFGIEAARNGVLVDSMSKLVEMWNKRIRDDY